MPLTLLHLQSADQCCFDPIVLVSVATQTDDLPTTVASDNASNGSSLVKTLASFNIPAEEWKISYDHNYSMSIPMVYPTYGLDEHSLTPYKEIEAGPLVENRKISYDHNYSMSIPMVYPTYGLDEHSLIPYKEIEVGPLVENNIDNDFDDKEVYHDDIDDDYKDPNWNLPNGKKSCFLMEISPPRKNQKVNYNLLAQIKHILFLATV